MPTVYCAWHRITLRVFLPHVWFPCRRRFLPVESWRPRSFGSAAQACLVESSATWISSRTRIWRRRYRVQQQQPPVASWFSPTWLKPSPSPWSSSTLTAFQEALAAACNLHLDLFSSFKCTHDWELEGGGARNSARRKTHDRVDDAKKIFAWKNNR